MFNPIQNYEYGKQVFLKFTKEFENSYWKIPLSGTANAVSVVPNAVTAPDGSLTADRMYNGLASATPCILYEDQLRIMSGKNYALSIYAKAGAHGIFQIFGRNTTYPSTSYANFDLVNGIVTATGAGTTARIQLDNNGWYRCMITGVSSVKGIGVLGIGIVETATSLRQSHSLIGDEVFIWGAKVELGTVATNYRNEFTQTVYTGASPL